MANRVRSYLIRIFHSAYFSQKGKHHKVASVWFRNCFVPRSKHFLRNNYDLIAQRRIVTQCNNKCVVRFIISAEIVRCSIMSSYLIQVPMSRKLLVKIVYRSANQPISAVRIFEWKNRNDECQVPETSH